MPLDLKNKKKNLTVRILMLRFHRTYYLLFLKKYTPSIYFHWVRFAIFFQLLVHLEWHTLP